ncbi:hypothetical protein [Pseudonocardia charpentierae]|uniref:4Fe-4S ferredoxin-type domain-containing protein n=1 Tax=Pseudonocardia charpentierae TaxID=3075545 RepID=A0ABU2NHE8_9PSEU|nr:hypothetical protein [Pseudonocardia sp. DSM 45834]MDT0353140.1 hypothetical protein [Pseudonocardia sp. DSM 45834]
MTMIDDEFDLDLRPRRTGTGPVEAGLLAEFDLDVRLGVLTTAGRPPADDATEPLGVPTRGLPGQTCDTRNDTCFRTCDDLRDTCAFSCAGTCPDDTCPTWPTRPPAFPC